MRAVLFRMGSVLRNRLFATLVVTLIVAVVCGVVLGFAAGARRTSTAPDRYTASFGGSFDALVQQSDGEPPRSGEVASLPTVQSVEPMTFVFGVLIAADGTSLDSATVFIGSFRAGGVRVVEGRETDPHNPNEFVASRSFLEQNHANLGDSFDLVTLTPQQAHDFGFAMDDPQGPRVSIVLVGVVDGAVQLEDPVPFAVASPALLDNYEIGVADTLMAVDLQPGADLTMLREQLDTLPQPGLSLEPGVLIGDPVRNAVQAQARGLWILALVAAIAATAVLGQMINRQVRPARDERERLSAIGFTESQVLADAVGRAIIPITIGSLVGAVLAIAPSGFFPFGFVRVLEPNPGMRADWAVLVGGAAIFIGLLTLWTVVALALTGWATRTMQASPVVEAIATRAASPTVATGMRMAFTRGIRERGSVRGSVIGVLLCVAGVAAAITFGVSLDRLVHQPFRYGNNYDVAVGDNGADALPEGIVERLVANPDVKSLTLYAGTQARVGERSVPVLGVDAVRGTGQPRMRDGRLPASADEIAFGRLTANDIGAHIGDDIEMVGPSQTQVFRVTGIAVVPGLGANDGIGEGGVVTMDGFTRLDNTSQPTNAAVQLGVGLPEFAKSVPEFGDGPPPNNFVPSAIVNVGHIRAVPFVLAAVLAALALLTVSHVMLTSTRNRRRDVAILRSIGADRRWITRAVLWQATLLTALPVVVGVPVGIVVGRLVFATFADSMGAIRDASIPVAVVAIGAMVTVGLANAIAAAASRAARHNEPAQLLQGE
ncbi:MAG: FtsX-like permease family protein [Ilumatobacteraceae bacterium]